MRSEDKMTKQNFERNLAELNLNRLGKKNDEASLKFKKYHVEITMIKPYEVLDFWFKKPDLSNILEVFMDELNRANPNEYFKFKVREI
jgi:hypothetical protein